jgi:hypothetical protein
VTRSGLGGRRTTCASTAPAPSACTTRSSATWSWHGAAATRLIIHLALNEVDDQHAAANWGEKVTDDEYAAAAATND